MTEDELLERIASGKLIEGPEYATDKYVEGLRRTLIAYRLLRDLGEDVEALVYERDPKDFRHPYAFDVPLDTWAEMVVANGFYDRAGFCLLDDIFQNSSYGPWKRALVKVEREENFHLRHGERWMATMAGDPEQKAELQAAVD